MKCSYLEWNGIIWNEIEVLGIKMNEKECSRSVPTRNVPIHRKACALLSTLFVVFHRPLPSQSFRALLFQLFPRKPCLIALPMCQSSHCEKALQRQNMVQYNQLDHCWIISYRVWIRLCRLFCQLRELYISSDFGMMCAYNILPIFRYA